MSKCFFSFWKLQWTPFVLKPLKAINNFKYRQILLTFWIVTPNLKTKNKKPKPKRNTLEQCHEFKLLLQSYETKKKKKKKRVCRFFLFRCWHLFCLRIGRTFFGSFGHRLLLLLLLLFHSFYKIPVNEMNTLCSCSYMFHSRMFAALILPLQTHKMVSKEWIEFVVSSSWNSKNSILFFFLQLWKFFRSISLLHTFSSTTFRSDDHFSRCFHN